MMQMQLRLSVLKVDNPVQVLSDFIREAQLSYALTVIQSPVATGEGSGEALILVPFADRENIRITYNIFAARFSYPAHLCMESV